MQAAAHIVEQFMDRDRFTDLITDHHRGLTAYATVLAKSQSTAN